MQLRLFFLLTILMCFTAFTVQSQLPVNTQDTILTSLKIKALRGDKRSFRDIGSLLGSQVTKDSALQTLQNLSLFADEKIILDASLTKQSFLDFYYKNQTSIYFSQLYGAFVIDGFDNKKVLFKTTPKVKEINVASLKIKEIARQIEVFVESENIDSTLKVAQKLWQFNNNEAFNILISLSKDKRIQRSKAFRKSSIYAIINDGLGVYKKKEAFDAVLYLLDNQLIEPALTSFSLARISNVFAAHEGTDATLAQRYRKYADSLQTFEALRAFGYKRYSNKEQLYYENQVDYYASLLATAAITDSYWWIRENALHDMMATLHPRSLYYLATQVYLERNRTVKFGYSSDDFLRQQQAYLRETLQIEDKKGDFVTNPVDLTAKKNYIAYWTQHWNNYEWDDYIGFFVNKEEKLAQKENYERLFRRLSSTNDSVAIQSYRELSQGEPSEIVKLNSKYRSLLRSVNFNLPNFKSKILENLAFLTEFCRQNNIPYQASNKDLALFQILASSLSPAQRYLAENEIVQQLRLEQLSAFEYWAIFYENNLSVSYSASRILDRWYSSHWQEIISSDIQFRLFLKKTALFARFGVVGSCGQYIKKINIQDKNLSNYLKALLLTEADADILEVVRLLIPPPPPAICIDYKAASAENANIQTLISLIKIADVLDIEAINAVTQSQQYKAEYRALCLAALPKVMPVEELFLLKIVPKMSIKNGDLSYLKSIAFNYKELDDIPRLFEMDDAEKMFTFMMERAQDFSVDEAGTFLNNIFRSAWFSTYINSGIFPRAAAKELRLILERYLNESELISEFEEQATQRNIAQLNNIGLPLLEKLNNTMQFAADDETKTKIISEIIARVNYEDLGLVVPFMTQFGDINGRSAMSFLQEDFGLPIFGFVNLQSSNEFVQNHIKLTELEFYKYYLIQFGVDFLKKDGNLDMEKIYNNLRYDLVTPFTGTGGNKRDFYVYGLIKILELKFVTRLGFHHKLNESQTFYSYNSSKRVEAWLKYIVENKIYRPENEMTKGFNQ